MKKTFGCFLCLALFVFVSCSKPSVKDEDDVPSVPGYEDAIRLQALNSEYSTGAEMGYSSAVSHSFLLMFATSECEVINGNAFGTGDILVLEVCSETADNLIPAEGFYDIADMIEDGVVVAGFEMLETPIGTYLYNMVDDERAGYKFITNGSVEIKKTAIAGEVEVFVDARFEDGKQQKYYYKGALLVEDVYAE